MNRFILVLSLLLLPLAVVTSSCQSEKEPEEHFGPSPFGSEFSGEFEE